MKIPEICLSRLPVYLNYLRTVRTEYISSREIAKALGYGEVLVRKDLAYTPAEGKPRRGYSVEELKKAIEEKLTCGNLKRAAVLGAGGLGRALLAYGGFSRYGIEVVAAYDTDPLKAGAEIAGKPVIAESAMRESLERLGVSLIMLCVPASAAREAAASLEGTPVKAILNFAPAQISAEGITVRNLDVAANLAVLASMI